VRIADAGFENTSLCCILSRAAMSRSQSRVALVLNYGLESLDLQGARQNSHKLCEFFVFINDTLLKALE